MTIEESTIARIRALLAKARDPAASEAEAAAAAAASERLLARYALDMRDIERPSICEHKTGIRYLEPWARNIAVQTARLYGCEPLITEESVVSRSRKNGETKKIYYRSVSVYGRTVSAEVATSMINYLISTTVRMSREFSSERRAQLQFQRGAGERLAHRVWELRMEQQRQAETQDGRGDGTSLVVQEQNEAREFLTENISMRKTRATKSNTRSHAAHAGWNAAGSVHLGGQVGGEGGKALLN